VSDLEPIEEHLRSDDRLDPDSHVVVRGWPLTVDGMLRNADATRTRFSWNGAPLVAVSAEITVGGWTVDAILAGPRLRTRSRYAETTAASLVCQPMRAQLPSTRPNSWSSENRTPARCSHRVPVGSRKFRLAAAMRKR